MLPQIQPEAMHHDEYVVTAGMRIGAVTERIPKKGMVKEVKTKGSAHHDPAHGVGSGSLSG